MSESWSLLGSCRKCFIVLVDHSSVSLFRTVVAHVFWTPLLCTSLLSCGPTDHVSVSWSCTYYVTKPPLVPVIRPCRIALLLECNISLGNPRHRVINWIVHEIWIRNWINWLPFLYCQIWFFCISIGSCISTL